MGRPRSVTLEVSVAPTQAVRALRQLAEEADWDTRHEEGSRLVDRWLVIMPLARTTRTFRLAVTSGEGEGIVLTAWSEVRGTAGGITVVEMMIPSHLTGDPLKQLIRAWAAKHPRCPWRWSFGERSVVGFLLPVWRRSRKGFTKFGIDTSRSGWPLQAQWPPTEWPALLEEE